MGQQTAARGDRGGVVADECVQTAGEGLVTLTPVAPHLSEVSPRPFVSEIGTGQGRQ